MRLFDLQHPHCPAHPDGLGVNPALERIVRALGAAGTEAQDVAAQQHGIVRLAALPSSASRVLARAPRSWLASDRAEFTFHPNR